MNRTPSPRPSPVGRERVPDLSAAARRAKAKERVRGDVVHRRVLAGRHRTEPTTFNMKALITSLSVLSAALAVPSHAADKTLIDYFLPMSIRGPLVSNVWGAPGVFPRDPQNGLEDVTMTQWCYWDGQIIKRPEGRFHLFASRWDQARGHRGWWGSLAVHAVSDHVVGPYLDTGLCWPDNQGGKGHNVTALVLPDGRYAVVVNGWSDRKAYHITSPDGIGNWTFRGLAYDPTRDFLRYTDGTVNHWDKIERPGVLIENGHVTHFTFAVLDVPKEQEKGNDTHGSKIIVVPFDGAALDRDLQDAAKAGQPAAAVTPRP